MQRYASLWIFDRFLPSLFERSRSTLRAFFHGLVSQWCAKMTWCIDTPSVTSRCTALGWFGGLLASTMILTSKSDNNPLQPEMCKPAAISQGHSQGTLKTCAKSSVWSHRFFPVLPTVTAVAGKGFLETNQPQQLVDPMKVWATSMCVESLGSRIFSEGTVVYFATGYKSPMCKRDACDMCLIYHSFSMCAQRTSHNAPKAMVLDWLEDYLLGPCCFAGPCFSCDAGVKPLNLGGPWWAEECL